MILKMLMLLVFVQSSLVDSCNVRPKGTCEDKWTLEKMIPFVSRNNNTIKWTYDNLNIWDGKQKWSEIVKIGPTKWRIIIEKNMIDGINYLGIYLTYSEENELEKNWFCRTNTTIKLINQTGQKLNITKADTAIHNHIVRSWGWNQFYKWDDLIKNGYMKDYSIVSEIEMSFKYYNFSKNILNSTDIILKVNDTEFHTNKAILRKKSEYFNDLFANENNQQTIIEINNVEIAEFRYFFASFYPLFDGVNEESYEYLSKFAEKYKIPVLQADCEQFWLERFEVSLENADRVNDPDLLDQFITSLDTIQKIRVIQTSQFYPKLRESTRTMIENRVMELNTNTANQLGINFEAFCL
ncbi:unnamed protein product [Caenorhabditis angaria]|uniref:BTB domain-containing protein n=1 Tax=Caenorhabditis angaria TaxID=860376 RepID=A0A9P1IBR3_9PELO|nr:unnamed protein product [Caenorhabditis angaria]